MLEPLDKYLLLTPASAAKWQQFSQLDKDLISFMFLECLLMPSKRFITRFPPLVINGKTAHRFGVDIQIGYLVVLLYGKRWVLLDLHRYRSAAGPGSPPSK
jgi:hypothetical protein